VSIELDATATDGGAATRGRSDRLTAGDLLAHFRAERLLGQGAMGDVWLATDLALDRPVAIKVLPPDVARDPGRRERLLREARAQARIQHPHVCHIYYVGEEGDRVFFAMEYIPGETLAERLERGPIPPDEALEIARMAALGLREGYRHGFTHRDIKPSNLMLDGHGQLKVVDFGLVTRGEIADPAAGEAVAQTALVGTPLYMAPEQARGDAVDFRADVYALGATLHHLVTGRPPFGGSTAAELRAQHESADRPALGGAGRRGRRVAALCDLVARMMARRAVDRHGSYDELVGDLDRISLARNPPVGLFMRGAAAAIDWAVPMLTIGAVMFALNRVSDLVGITGCALASIAATARWGTSLGRLLFDLEVVSVATGRPPTLRRAALRWILEYGVTAVGFLLANGGRGGDLGAAIGLGLAGVGSAFAIAEAARASWREPDKRTLWDRAGGTVVRYRRARA